METDTNSDDRQEKVKKVRKERICKKGGKKEWSLVSLSKKNVLTIGEKGQEPHSLSPEGDGREKKNARK